MVAQRVGRRAEAKHATGRGASTYALQHLDPLLLFILSWLESLPEEVGLVRDRILGNGEEPHLTRRPTLLEPARQAAALLRAEPRHARARAPRDRVLKSGLGVRRKARCQRRTQV